MSVKNFKQYVNHLNKSLFINTIQKIKRSDVLMVIDMQNDFIDRKYKDKNKTFKTGKLATYEAKKIIRPICNLMDRFKDNKANIIATRDYHSGGKNFRNHCSFPIFGEHCVWNTKGSDLAKEIEQKLISRQNKFYKRCNIAFKAIHPTIDSFGSFKYTKNYALNRVCGCTKSKCPVSLTGGYLLKKFVRYPNIKKLKQQKKFTTINQYIGNKKKKGTLYLTGVLLDFCVLDTAINAKKNGYKKVVIVIDLTRGLRIKKNNKPFYPVSPKQLSTILQKNKIKLILSKSLSS